MPEVAQIPQASSMPLDGLSPGADRDRIDLYLAAFLARARRQASNPHVRPLFDRTSAFLLRGGKRIRPRLGLASYRIISGRPSPPRSVWLAASSLELFHGFMLVHDDLIDGSLVRRGRPTLHEEIQLAGDQSGRGAKRAADLGLVAGDLLCALGMRLIARSGLDETSLAQAHRLISDMLFDTGLGEALDMLYEDCPLDALSEAQVIEAYLRKTARYSVSTPLVLGATIAGASSKTIKSLSRFGDLLGLGYQIQNDLDALAVDPEPENPDLDSGKRTLVLWEAHRAESARGRRSLVEALRESPGIPRRRKLLELIASSDAIARCRDRIGALAREANDVLRTSGLDPERRRAFLALASLLPQHAGRSPGVHDEPATIP